MTVSFDFRPSQTQSHITVSMADGYAYEFDGYVMGGNLDIYYPSSAAFSVISSWRLSSIVAPNGRRADFGYQRGANHLAYHPASLCYNVARGNNPVSEHGGGGTSYDREVALGTTDALTGRLTSISVDGNEIASFTYDTPLEVSNVNTKDPPGTISNLSSGRLLGIRVHWGEREVRSCSMGYDNANPGKRNFLTSIDISGEGTYRMVYDNPDKLPVYGTFRIDHWGYFNNDSRAEDTFLKVTSTPSSSPYDEVYVPGNPREPNATYARYGMLKRIVYPTGGYSDFEYEAHDYSHYMERKHAGGFYPQLVSGTGTAGGVRIGSVTTCASDGTVLLRKEYSYKNGTSSSGTLVNRPRYSIEYSATRGINFNLGTIWSNNLGPMTGTHIEYGTVTETSLDGSSVRYVFSDSSLYPDELVCERTLPDRAFGLVGVEDWTLVPEVLPNLFMLTSRQDSRGKLLSRTFIDASGAVVAEETTDYEDSGEPEYTYALQYTFFSIGEIGTYTGLQQVGSTSRSWLYGETKVAETTDMGYNPRHQLSRTSVTGSRGESVTSRTVYVSDVTTDGVYKTMSDKGLIAFPVEESLSVKEAGGSETSLTKRKYGYVQPSASSCPKLYRTSVLTETDVIGGTSRMTSYSYDARGRMLESVDPSGRHTTYIWGYGGLYPVAIVEGAGLSSVKSIAGLSGLSSAPLEGDASEYDDALRALPGSSVTTYGYLPLVGVTSETGPDGRTTTYTYNATGKLFEVLDALGCTTRTYLYSTDNRQ